MRIIRSFRNKIRSKRGETLTETLTSLLIIVPAMVMLAGAIVSAAKINYEARISEASTYTKYAEENASDGTITKGGADFAGINWYKDDDTIYYYFR